MVWSKLSFGTDVPYALFAGATGAFCTIEGDVASLITTTAHAAWILTCCLSAVNCSLHDNFY